MHFSHLKRSTPAQQKSRAPIGRERSRALRGRLGFAVLAALAIAAGAAVSRAPEAGAAPAQPNFIVLMTDDQTNGELSVMKQTRRRIEGQGVSFDRFVTSFPLCCPSRTTFLTGQYSHNHGVLGNGTPIGGYPAFDKQDTMASWLQDAGYHTIQIGKFLNGYPRPDDRTEVPPGWDEWYACLNDSENQYFNYTLNENGTLTHYGSAPSDYKTDVYGNKAVTALRQRAALGASGQPFFMFVAFTAPHLPATPAPRDRGRFRHRPLARARSFDEANVSDKPRFIRKMPRFTGAKVRKITRSYRSRLETLLSVDRVVGRVTDELQSDGMLSDTYILFMSDNGFFFGQHRLPKGKYLPYEGSSRTPTLMRGPGIPAGVHSDALVANVDTAPTILELAGATPSVTVDGRSLLPYAQNPRMRSDRPVLLEANTIDDPSPGIPYTGIETDRYKYIRYRDGEQELYDLARDPGELRSRHRDPRYRRTKRALAVRLARLQDCSGASCREPTGPIPGPH
jgi:arylsulfatase A-like enzyme